MDTKAVFAFVGDPCLSTGFHTHWYISISLLCQKERVLPHPLQHFSQHKHIYLVLKTQYHKHSVFIWLYLYSVFNWLYIVNICTMSSCMGCILSHEEHVQYLQTAQRHLKWHIKLGLGARKVHSLNQVISFVALVRSNYPKYAPYTPHHHHNLFISSSTKRSSICHPPPPWPLPFPPTPHIAKKKTNWVFENQIPSCICP